MATGSRYVNPYALAYTPTLGPIPGATLTFYLSGSSTLAETYADAGLATPNSNPVTADATGTFPNIFLDPAVTYKAVLQYPANGAIPGAVIYTADPAETVPQSTAQVPAALTANTGAAQIGSETGVNVETRLGNLDTEVATLTTENATLTTENAAIIAALAPTGFSALKLATIGISNHTSVITANWILLTDSTTGAPFLASAVNVSPVSTAAGANGLDAGSVAPSTWYYVYVIYNPTTTTRAGLFSLSATAPTLPAGYTYAARVGSVRTDASGSAYFLPTVQFGRRVQYAVTVGSDLASLPLMGSGVAGNTATGPTVAIAVAGFVPLTASAVRIAASVYTSGNATLMAAPNAAYGGNTTAGNIAPININISGANFTTDAQIAEFLLESASIYWASNSAGSYLQCFGWEDNL